MLVFTEVHYKGYLLVRDIIGMCRNVGLASSCRTAGFQVLNALSARGLACPKTGERKRGKKVRHDVSECGILMFRKHRQYGTQKGEHHVLQQ